MDDSTTVHVNYRETLVQLCTTIVVATVGLTCAPCNEEMQSLLGVLNEAKNTVGRTFVEDEVLQSDLPFGEVDLGNFGGFMMNDAVSFVHHERLVELVTSSLGASFRECQHVQVLYYVIHTYRILRLVLRLPVPLPEDRFSLSIEEYNHNHASLQSAPLSTEEAAKYAELLAGEMATVAAYRRTKLTALQVAQERGLL